MMNGDADNEGLGELFVIGGYMGGDEDVEAVFNKIDEWKKTTKSQKIKAQLKRFEAAFEKYQGDDSVWSKNKPLVAEYNKLNSIIKFNRC